MEIRSGWLKRFSWFLAANAAVVVSLAIITGGAALSLAPYLLLFSCTIPFFSLLFSKWSAKRAHGIYVIEPNHFNNETERNLYRLIETLSQRAGLQRVPEVGIYESADVNAFATGATRSSSMVAFSTGLLETLDEDAIAAVAAHEIAHIANGDMVTLALVQSVINTVIYIITIPLWLIKWTAFFSDQVSALAFWLITIAKFLITVFLVFLGSLVAKAFSRHREFKADQLAAQLVDPQSMIHALESLRQVPVITIKQQQSYAAFKINAGPSILDLFSTHPSLERRIARLRAMDDFGT